MNAHVHGTETPTPSIVTQIEIAWLQSSGGTPSENEATAVAAGRGVTLTSAQDCANFMNATCRSTAPAQAYYALSSANLISGQQYVPAVRVTDSAYGTGAWHRGTAFTASTVTTTSTTTSGPSTTTTTTAWIFADDFTTLDTSNWTVQKTPSNATEYSVTTANSKVRVELNLRTAIQTTAYLVRSVNYTPQNGRKFLFKIGDVSIDGGYSSVSLITITNLDSSGTAIASNDFNFTKGTSTTAGNLKFKCRTVQQPFVMVAESQEISASAGDVLGFEIVNTTQVKFTKNGTTIALHDLTNQYIGVNLTFYTAIQNLGNGSGTTPLLSFIELDNVEIY